MLLAHVGGDGAPADLMLDPPQGLHKMIANGRFRCMIQFFERTKYNQ